MYAIVELGETQFKVAEGDSIESFRLAKNAGETITLDKVLLLDDGKTVQIGQPYLKNVTVTAKVEQETLGEKVTAYKYRRRKNSSSIRGHRQKHTRLSISKISVG